MRRDRLDRAMAKIKQVRPKWFFKRCWQCTDDVKGEAMWRFRKYYSASLYGCSMRVWTCLKCAPTMAALIEAYPSEFQNVDVTPLREEDSRLKAANDEFITVDQFHAHNDSIKRMKKRAKSKSTAIDNGSM